MLVLLIFTIHLTISAYLFDLLHSFKHTNRDKNLRTINRSDLSFLLYLLNHFLTFLHDKLVCMANDVHGNDVLETSLPFLISMAMIWDVKGKLFETFQKCLFFDSEFLYGCLYMLYNHSKTLYFQRIDQ